MPDSWLILVNPVSGRGRALRRRREIETCLRRQGLRCEFVISEYPGHAIERVAQAVASGCRNILAVGGDGTVNECANALLRQRAVAAPQITLGVLPIGTGNDWARGLGLPKDPAAVAALMAGGRRRLLDAGRIELRDGAQRHFVNVAGVGFDAHVVAGLPRRSLGRLGPLAYLAGLAKGLFTYRAVPLRLTFSGRAIDTRAFVLFFALGRYCGNGMAVAPQAVADDGLLDITLVEDLSRHEVLQCLPRLFRGTLLEHPRVSALRAASLAIDAGPLPIEADGELVGTDPARIEVLPRALNVLGA